MQYDDDDAELQHSIYSDDANVASVADDDNNKDEGDNLLPLPLLVQIDKLINVTDVEAEGAAVTTEIQVGSVCQ